MSWQDELDATWDRIAELEPHELLDTITGIVERPEVPREVRAFQLACAHDSTGRSDLAVTGYRAALDDGLAGYQARRATIQLASSLRNLGRPQDSLALLDPESTTVGDGLDDAVVVFRALALADLDRYPEATASLVHALADHLPRYTASAHRYADALIVADVRGGGAEEH